MARDRDEETGQFNEEYSEEDFLSAVSDIETATTKKVAEEVGCSYDLAYRRLLALLEEGKVEKTQVGGSFVWHR